MRLFHYRQSEIHGEIPGLAEAAAAQGWQPVAGRPVSDALARAVFEIACAMYEVSPALLSGHFHPDASQARFQDAYRFADRGRTVTVANARAVMGTEARYLPGPPKEVSVCAVELPTLLPVLSIWPRRYRPVDHHLRATDTGDPAFDARFAVVAVPGFGLAEFLTPAARQRIMAHDDRAFHGDRSVFCCVSRGASTSVEQVTQGVGELLGIVDAFAAPVAAPPTATDPVAPASAELTERISRLHGPQDVMMFLQGLDDGERLALAASDSPLAGLAHARTPAEAMAALQTLDPAQRMQLMALFGRS